MLRYITVILLMISPPVYGVTLVGFGASSLGGRAGAATDATLTDSGEYPTGNRSFSSPYVATAGQVSYIFVDVGTSGLNPAYINPFVRDSSGNLLAYTDSCSGTNVVGTVYRYTLSSPITMAASTYRLGFSSGDYSFSLQYVAESGTTIYGDTTTYTENACPTSPESQTTDNLDYGSVYSFEGKLKIWVSNDANDY